MYRYEGRIRKKALEGPSVRVYRFSRIHLIAAESPFILATLSAAMACSPALLAAAGVVFGYPPDNTRPSAETAIQFRFDVLITFILDP